MPVINLKNITVVIGLKLLLIFLVPSSSLLIAQTSSDSINVIEELAPDIVIDTVQENKEPDEDVFIRKDDRYTLWRPAQQRNIPDTVISKLKKEDEFWYADEAGKKSEKKENNKKTDTPLGQQSWFRLMVWLVIIGGFTAFLATYLSGSNIGLFRKKKILISQNEQDGEMPEDIFAINYHKEIDKAAAIGNYRLAVRFMFLRLLKNMAEQKIIRYKEDKTNFDYLSELSSTSKYEQFFKVTRNYEYSWYGQFIISEEAYHLIKNDFDEFENQLNKIG